MLSSPLAALAQLSASDERAIYEKDAKDQVKLALSRKPPNAMLTRGAVPSEKVAVAIHQADAGAVFGQSYVDKQKPFKAIRSGDHWVVYGTVPGGGLGGTAVTVIRA